MSLDDRGRLSPGERALWLLQRLAPASAAYNLAGAVRIAALDPAALRRALRKLTGRHAALRTTYPADPLTGEPFRRVHPASSAPEPEIREETGADWPRRMETEAARPFDPAAGPLLRVWIGRDRIGGDGAVLFVLHHLIADFRSLALVLRDLGDLYREEIREETAGPPGGLPPVEISSYAEWVEEQERFLASPRGERLRAFWRQRLAGPPPVLALPVDRPRPPGPASGAGASCALALDRQATARLRELARARGSTFFAVLLAGFQALLYRVSGRRDGRDGDCEGDGDLWIGVPTAGRTAARWAGTLGYFVNPVILRGRPAAETPFTHLVDQAREEAHAALAHRDWPFPLLAAELPRLSFQAMLTFHRTRHPVEEALALLALGEGGGRFRLGGLDLETLPLRRQAAQTELALAAAVVDGALRAALEVDADLFDATTAARLLGHLGALLTGAAARPETPAGALPLLTAAERQEVLFEWNGAEWNGAGAGEADEEEASLAALFAAQAERTPEAVALVCGDTVTTYCELAARAGTLARRLRALGVGPEVRVALCVRRSPRLLAGLLGILAAGGVYVPLDPGHPRERLDFLLADCGAAVVVTEGPHPLTPSPTHSRLPGEGETGGVDSIVTPVVLLEDLEDAEGAPLELAAVGPEHLAYVLYTSGSTGRPKGVEIEHGSALAMLRWARRVFGPAERAAVLASTSVGFDLSVFELFLPLSTGGTVVLVEDALQLGDGGAAGVTLVNTVPSAMAELVRLGALPASVRTVCLAGERLPAHLAAAVHAALPGVRLLNLYGPTEATTYATWAAVRAGDGGGEPSIGRPVDGTRVWLLDDGLVPVPPGVAGELCLAGAGLARGYAMRPDLTAERFGPDPDPQAVFGARLYRTGDLARWRMDGRLELIGRRDEQVKLRGFRIEPGEVEAALLACSGVRAAAVVLRHSAENRRLVAYVAGEPQGIAAPALREHLAARLPAPFVPSAFVILPRLPLTPHGKVDRRALAALPLPAEAEAEGFVPPRDAVEEGLAAIWAEVLEQDPAALGTGDDFFALGGHSLLATRVLARVREVFGVALPLRDLFAAPTLAGLAERVRAAAPGVSEAVLRRDPALDGSPAPLSFAQERFWLADRLQPGSPAYNLAGAARLRGPLRPDTLRRAFGKIVLRHAVLRTRYPEGSPEGDGEPVAVAEPPRTADLPLIDLAALPESAMERETDRLAVELARRPFDLERGPVLRAALVRRAHEHDLLLAIHHIAADGASIDLFFRELAVLSGRPGSLRELPEPPVQYADFARWQRGRLTPEALAPLAAWWQAELAGAPAALHLTTDRPRALGAAGMGAGPGGVRRRRIDLPAGFGALRRRAGATPFMALAATFLTLLGRLSGQADVLVATPVSERGRRELEPLLGCLVNTMVLRGRMADDPSAADFLARVRAACLDGWAHQDLPFERLAGRPADRPEVRALFELHPRRAAGMSLGAATLALREVETGAAKADLALTVEDEGAALGATLRFRSDLFDGTTAERLLLSLEILLASATADPGARLGDLPLLTAAERHQVVVEWGEGPPAAPTGSPLLSRIAGLAAAAPDAPAVLFGRRVVRTRGELAQRAGALAAKLAGLGAGPGTVVGLCLNRSPELVESVLAVLATGAAYLPLDPAYPRAYLAHVLDDSAVPLVLTRAALRSALPETRGRVFILPVLEDGAAVRDGTPPEPSNLSETPAYLLYTSGSTGRPKGIPILHRSLSAYLSWVLAEPLAGIDGLPFVTSLGFDASLKQLFAPLLAGFPVRLVDDETARRPEKLLAELRGPGRLALNCIPSLWREVLDALEAAAATANAQPLGLVRLLLGGEGFDRGLLERTVRLLPGIEVWNLYGPTEATANAAAARLVATAGSIPIGRPLPGVRLAITDPHLRPLPAGAAGELLLGGTGVAPGYWRRPDLTAARFVPDPFSGLPGERLYRTGDRARFQAGSGDVELLGRIDQQVKVRGLRVEPAEIEAVLRGHPGVAECAVGTDAAENRLIAWVVLRETRDAISPAALRRHLESRLPAAMVPAVFTFLDALPRAPAGKVDRAALLVPEVPDIPEAAAGFRRSQTPAEEVLAGLWAETLGVAEVAAGDDFFALGGHSLLAARLLSRVRNAFGVDLPLSALFAAPTVAGLAAALAAARREGAAEPPPPPITEVDRDTRMFLSFAQERLWFLAQWMPDSPAYNIPAAVVLDGALDLPALAAALGEIVRRHEVLRTTFSAIAGLPVQILGAAAGVPLPLVDLTALGMAGEPAAALLGAEEARRPFDLHRGPLLRACLLRLAASRHVVLLSLHHIVADGWSMGVLIGELAALYRSSQEGRPSPLPPPRLQYADFSAWQRERAAGAGAAGDIAWWRSFLAGAPAGIDLPSDRPRPGWSIHRGALSPFQIDPPRTGRLRSLARQGGATLFMILLTAFQALLARLSGATDLVVGTAVDQRTPEVEGLIGLFVNLLALRGDLSGDPPFAELLARTRRATLDAHDHRDLPFERLVAAVEPVRHPGRNPLFQVAFSLQSAPLPEAALPGLTLAVSELDTGTARFDLTLLLREAAGGVAGSLEHSTDLFDAATIDRVLRSLANLLAGVAAGEGVMGLPLSHLPLLAAEERRQILEDWTHSADRRPREGCLGELFVLQAVRAPQAVALVACEEEMTYGELVRRAWAVARRLRALGAGPDVPVALCLERSPELVVGMLGIVLAGAAYVPLDLAYPVERLAWMLEDSGARIVVTRGVGVTSLSAALGRLLEAGGLRIVDLDQTAEAAEDLPGPVEIAPISPDNLAYVVFTSGSTGRPKGVAATHRGVTRLVVDPGYVDLGPAETLLQLAPVSFDASTFEIWGALLNGGRLALPPPGPVALRELGELLRRHEVTTLFLTTGLFHQMIDEEPAGLAGLGQLLFGGDVASTPRVRRALDLLPGVRLIHAYGPTEATTFATCATVSRDDATRARLSIGRPVPRTSAQILDAGLEPVPPGIPGELWLGGDGLARGYLGRPELTAERFVPSPFPPAGEGGGERLYRTGDLARWLPDGGVDLLGRIDRQVKIRGFRVEPAEVEAALERHPGIAAAVVQPRGEGGDRRLVAWIVPAGDLPADADLLVWCRERLPPFLVPAAFVRLAALPLDPNGKVDRGALPEPERSRRAEDFVAPRTPVESKVAAVWTEVLGLDRIGAEDDFFLLGGHSLLATQIVSRLSRDFGVEIGLRAFFAEPTVAGVATAVTREQIRQGNPERMARLLARVRDLSPEELAELLREERSEPGR
ncbi:MAG TPA: amino acid adenylation domain-containing protein [Thermoanaerobaculia bacterium]|jgi:amino acid adenylation domain-containing protein|nr:amino acid adenylation domain-containing protein [Thermoanaerobaculia bacterium]